MSTSLDASPARHVGRGLAGRRLVFAALVLATAVALAAALARVLATDGLGPIDLAILLCFLVTLPWNAIGFWNSVVGLALLQGSRDPMQAVVPQLANLSPTAAPRGRTAIVMPIHDEDPARVLRHLRATLASLDRTGATDRFELFVLSDTRDAAIAAEEESRFRLWRALDPLPDRLHYRRREHNTGAKTGNLWDFIERWGDRFDYFIVLDADSLMSGAALTRLVRLMDANPELGIVQAMVTGLPSRSAFARIFQFGMRHAMRSYTLGAAWWQGDAGPYWGHNAIIRMAPFRRHCRLPTLPGRPPFGGRILSHDQVEAVLMRRAGYEVRVLPDELGSYEENPPTLPDFLVRDLRWCQGNMQYLKLLGRRGIPLLGRVQLLLAVLMYVQAPAWLLFMALGMTQAVLRSTGLLAPPESLDPAAVDSAIRLGIAIFLAVMSMVFSAKLAGVAHTLLQPELRRAYGGGWRMIGSTLVELVFSVLLSPVLAVLHSKFILGMVFGRTVTWTAQARAARHVPLAEAFRNLWLPTLIGAGLLAIARVVVPAALPWLLPVVTGMLLAAPLAWATSLRPVGRLLEARRICAQPEEFRPPEEVRAAGYAPLLAPPRPSGADRPGRLAGAPSGTAEPVATMARSD